MPADRDRPGVAAGDPERLLSNNLALVERVVDRVCRNAGLRDADADDFASVVKLALIENDYAMLRAWEGRASLATYLTTVVQRLLCDERSRTRGRWEPSAAARRGGEAAILLESLVCRDGRPLEQAIPLVRAIDPSLSRADLEAILEGMPRRVPRPRPFPLEGADLQTLRAPEQADAGMHSEDLARLSAEASRVIRRTLASCSVQDRTIVRLRFGSEMSVADISRMLRLPQRPLYRRLNALLQRLSGALIAAGIDVRAAESLIGSAVQALDFGLTEGKSEGLAQSVSGERPRTKAEE